MKIKIGDFTIVSDSRQFIVKQVRKVEDKDSENYGQDYETNIAYCTSFKSALKFVSQQAIRDSKDVREILEKLDVIEKQINSLPNPIKVEVKKDKGDY